MVVANFATTKKYGRREGFTQVVEVEYYNLDVILSVGYRVKSIRGTQFRQWANNVLKEYLLRGYAVNQRINQLEDKVDRRFADYDQKIENLNQQVDFFVKTSLPPKERLFFDGQLFDAHILMSRLVESAEKRIVLIDNYIDAHDRFLIIDDFYIINLPLKRQVFYKYKKIRYICSDIIKPSKILNHENEQNKRKIFCSGNCF